MTGVGAVSTTVGAPAPDWSRAMHAETDGLDPRYRQVLDQRAMLLVQGAIDCLVHGNLRAPIDESIALEAVSRVVSRLRSAARRLDEMALLRSSPRVGEEPPIPAVGCWSLSLMGLGHEGPGERASDLDR